MTVHSGSWHVPSTRGASDATPMGIPLPASFPFSVLHFFSPLVTGSPGDVSESPVRQPHRRLGKESAEECDWVFARELPTDGGENKGWGNAK